MEFLLPLGHSALLRHLMPFYEKSFAHLTEFGKFQDPFSEHLAVIATLSSINPVEHGWRNRFLAASGPEGRKTWAAYIGQNLNEMGESSKQNAWNSRIADSGARRARFRNHPGQHSEMKPVTIPG